MESVIVLLLNAIAKANGDNADGKNTCEDVKAENNKFEKLPTCGSEDSRSRGMKQKDQNGREDHPGREHVDLLPHAPSMHGEVQAFKRNRERLRHDNSVAGAL